MKKAALALTAMAFFLPLIAGAQEEGYYDKSFARLSYVKGDIVVERGEGLGSEQGVINLALVEGDKLVTGVGRAEVHFGKKNYLRLDDQTEVEFSVLPRQGDDRVRLHLLAGKIYLRISYMEEEKMFEVHTPDASFYILEEGLYRVNAFKDGQTELMVVEGSAEAAGEQGSQLVGSRESLMASNGSLGSQRALSYSRDDFANWNEDRDSLQNQYVSKRYLPAELEDYESELDSNGSWTYERPYGYVWVPYVVSTDWRPYYYGRWVWYPLCGWNWVSYEPWGWCAYHYGRWHWRLGLGWYWIPQSVWGPAWVHWYWGDDYIGWCPLGWYNRPVVIVNNYFYDYYHHDRYPADSRALTVVHKNQLRDPNISRVALNHVEASRLGQINLSSKQPDLRTTISRGGLSPESGSGIKALTQSGGNLSGKSSGILRNESPLKPSGSASLGKSPVGSRSDGNSLKTKSTSPNLSRGKGISTYPSGRSETKSGPSSSRGISSSPRKIRTGAVSSDRPSGLSSRSGVKSYSPSRSLSSPERGSAYSKRDQSRVYSPSSQISRSRSSSSSSSGSSRREFPSLSGTRSREGNSKSYSFSSSSPRKENFSSSRSTPSSSKSVFSAPRSSSSPRSFSAPRSSGFKAPSVSRSSPRSFSAPRSSGFKAPSVSRSSPRSFSAPRSSSFRAPSVSRSTPSSASSRSSGSHGSSGRVVKKNG